MDLEIPLINDLTKTFSNFDINSYFDIKIIEMYNNFINNNFKKYTNNEIYDYIKFINITCSDVKFYKHVVKYITKDNFNYFSELFDNYDICIELFNLLQYEIVSQYPQFNGHFKELWCEKNFDKSLRYLDEFKEFLIYTTGKNYYYYFNGKIKSYICDNMYFDMYNVYRVYNDILFSRNDFPNDTYVIYKSEHIYILVKYIYDILYNKYYQYNKFNESIIENITSSIKILNLDLIKFFVDYSKSKNLDINLKNEENYIKNVMIYNKIDIIEYLYHNTKINIDYILLTSIKYNNIEITKYLLNNGSKLYDEKLGIFKHTIALSGSLLMEASENENFEMIKLLIESDIILSPFENRVISKCKNLDIVKYIIDNIKNIDINELYINVINDKNYIIGEYIEDNYNLGEMLSFGGNVKYIKNINHINNNILYRNSEDVCIELFEKLFECKLTILSYGCYEIKELSKIKNFNYFLEGCISQGYLKLLMYIMDKVKNVKNVIIYNINDLAKYCKYDDDIYNFVNYLTNIEYIINSEIIIEYLIINGHLKTLKYFFNKSLFKNNIYSYLNSSINSHEIKIFKYLIGLDYHIMYKVNNIYILSIYAKNFEVFKYLIDKYICLIENSLSYFDSSNYNFNNYIDYIKYLANKGAHIPSTVLERCCLYKRFDILDYLLKIKIKIKNKKNLKYLIEQLVYNNDYDSIIYLYENYRKYIGPKCKALSIAMNNDNYYLSKKLLKYIQVHDNMLVNAYNNNNLNIVILLIENGINVNVLKEHFKNDVDKTQINDYLFENGLII